MEEVKQAKYNKAVYERDREYYKEYMKAYNLKRYKTDPEYRAKKLASSSYTRKTTNCQYCKRRVSKTQVEDEDDIKCHYCQKYGIPKEA